MEEYLNSEEKVIIDPVPGNVIISWNNADIYIPVGKCWEVRIPQDSVDFLNPFLLTENAKIVKGNNASFTCVSGNFTRTKGIQKLPNAFGIDQNGGIYPTELGKRWEELLGSTNQNNTNIFETVFRALGWGELTFDSLPTPPFI